MQHIQSVSHSQILMSTEKTSPILDLRLAQVLESLKTVLAVAMTTNDALGGGGGDMPLDSPRLCHHALHAELGQTVFIFCHFLTSYGPVATVNSLPPPSLNTHSPIVDNLSCAHGSKKYVSGEAVAEEHSSQDTDQWNALVECLTDCYC